MQNKNKTNNEKSRQTVSLSTLQLAQKKITSLRKIKADYLSLIGDIKNGWESEYRNVKHWAEGVDTAKTMIDIFSSLVGIVRQGQAAIKLSGEALEKANKELARSAIKDAYMPIVEATGKTIGNSANEKDGDVILFGKLLLKAWDDVNSPSYWASKYTGVDIEETNKKINNDIESEKSRNVQMLDEKILKAEMELIKLKRAYSGISPVQYH